jgi:hypothetical protein
MTGEVFSGYEDEGDYGQDRLLDAGWLSADDAKTLQDAAFKWIRLRRGIDYSHNGHETRCAADEVEQAFIEVFGLDAMTKHWVGGKHVLHVPEPAQ